MVTSEHLLIPKIKGTINSALASEIYRATEKTHDGIHEVVLKLLHALEKVKMLEINAATHAEGWKEYLTRKRDSLLHSSFPILLETSRIEAKLPNELMTGLTSQYICALLDLKKSIDNKDFPPDVYQGKPMDMSQYDHVFSTSRIPEKGNDKLQTSSASEHIAVLHKGQIYIVKVMDKSGNFSFDSIRANILHIISSPKPVKASSLIQIGTAANRDNWAEMQKTLKTNKANEYWLNLINQSLFVVCLDDSSPKTLSDRADHLRNGDVTNRWFDAATQLVITKNGSIGLINEHAAVDGSVKMRIASEMAKRQSKYKNWTYADKKSKIPNPNGVSEVNWRINESTHHFLESSIVQAINELQNQTSITFEDKLPSYLRDSRLNDDSVIQLAIYITNKRLNGYKPLSQLEPVNTRHLSRRLGLVLTSLVHDKEVMTNQDLVQAIKNLDEAKLLCKKGEDPLELLNTFMGSLGKRLNLPAHFPIQKLITLLEATICKYDERMKSLFQPACIASNGGVNKAIAAFGTINTLADNSLAIGYTKGDDKYTFNLQAKGKYILFLTNYQKELHKTFIQLALIHERKRK